MRQLWFLIVLGLIAVLVAPALAKHIEWTAPASYTDNTAIEASVLAKMKYYVRTKAPNPRSSTPDGTGWYYLGETPENNTTT